MRRSLATIRVRQTMLWWLAGSLLLTALVAALAAASASWLGQWSARALTSSRVRNGLIFYDTGPGGRSEEIRAVRPDGSGLHRVTRHGLEPSVSADGRL